MERMTAMMLMTKATGDVGADGEDNDGYSERSFNG